MSKDSESQKREYRRPTEEELAAMAGPPGQFGDGMVDDLGGPILAAALSDELLAEYDEEEEGEEKGEKEPEKQG